MQTLSSVEIQNDTDVFIGQINYKYPLGPMVSPDTEIEVTEHQLFSKYINEINDMNAFSHIIRCIPDCIMLKKERHGLMYGSHVIYKKEEYITPCGIKCNRIDEYRILLIHVQFVHSPSKFGT